MTSSRLGVGSMIKTEKLLALVSSDELSTNSEQWLRLSCSKSDKKLLSVHQIWRRDAIMNDQKSSFFFI